MSLQVKKNAAASVNSITKLWNGPYDAGGEQTEIAVTTGPGPGTTLVTVSGDSRAFVSLRNTSTGGQQIRVGAGLEPSFTVPVAGMLLMPGETFEVYDCALLIQGRADSPGALCSRFVLRSSPFV